MPIIDVGLRTWLATLVVSGLGVPIARAALAPLGRAAALLGPAAGLLALTWLTWLLSRSALAAPGEGAPSVALVVLGLVALGLRLRIGPAAPGTWRLAAVGGLLGTAVLVAFATLRAYAPDLTTGEQPMDLAILQSIVRAPSLPPEDAWLAGEPLNYYYGGQLALAALGRVGGVGGTAYFNVAGGLVPALCAVSLFGVAVALHDAAAAAGRAASRLAVPAGLTAAGLGVLVGNLRAAQVWLADPVAPVAYPWGRAADVGLGATNEFPLFAFVHGEVHAHMLAVPFALLVVAGAARVALHGPGRAVGVVLAVAVGGLYVVNGWDLPTGAALVVGGAVLWASRPGRSRRRAAVWGAAVLVGAGLAWLPFPLDLISGASGVGLVTEPTGLARFLAFAVLMFGLPLVLLAGRLPGALRRAGRSPLGARGRGPRVAVVAGIVVVVAVVTGHGATALVLLGAGGLAVAALSTRRDDPLRVLLGLAALGVALAGAGEVAFVRDNYQGGASYRMNTIFKFGYQAWWLLALAAAASVWRRDGRPRGAAGVGWRFAAGVAVAGALTFTVLAPVARTTGFERSLSLDGLAWMDAVRPGDAAAIRWLDAQPGTPRILEAVGDDYGPTARVSSFTGLPALSGWAGHELSWGRALGFERKRLVDDLYRSTDVTASATTLRRAGIVFVVVGALERDRYPAAGLRKFARLGPVAFAAGDTTVYRVG